MDVPQNYGRPAKRDQYRDFIPTSLRRLINNALSVDPVERYQSADKMRHALEQQKLLVAWRERRTPRGSIWKGESVDERQFHVSLSQNVDRKWEIEFKTGSANKLRRKSADCHGSLTKAKSRQLARRILQRVTQNGA